jgi:hypothetical protein
MKISLRTLCTLLLFLAQYSPTAQTAAPSPHSTAAAAPASADARADDGRPFTPEEKAQLAARLLAPSRAAGKTTPQRRKVISVTTPADTEASPRARGRRLARLVVFNHGEGKAATLVVDASTTEVLAREPIRGRPQASEEERQDAIKIIRRDPELERLVQANAIFEGGFIVDGPRGAPPKNRFLQLQLLTPDRLHLQRTVTVDLTAETIVSSKTGD